MADARNCRIRSIDSGGNVSTVAGGPCTDPEADGTAGVGGTARFSGPLALAVDDSGQIFVVDESSNIREIERAGNVTTVARMGPSTEPVAIAVDALDTLYVVDYPNRILTVNLPDAPVVLVGNGSTISRDGSGGPEGTASFGYANGIAIHGTHTAYVADQPLIRKIVW